MNINVPELIVSTYLIKALFNPLDLELDGSIRGNIKTDLQEVEWRHGLH